MTWLQSISTRVADSCPVGCLPIGLFVVDQFSVAVWHQHDHRNIATRLNGDILLHREMPLSDLRPGDARLSLTDCHNPPGLTRLPDRSFLIINGVVRFKYLFTPLKVL
jgi:hypothetical protein